MKKKIIVISIFIMFIIEGIFIYNLFKPNKEVILENVKTVDIFDNKDKTISIMVQDPKTFQYNPDTSRTSWPQKTEYMYAGTKCTDASGNDIGDTTPYIKFDESDYTATITTKKTIYCSLYFANGRPALEVLKAKGGNVFAGGGDHTTAVDGLYRFRGTVEEVTNNYICLGKENPDTCKSNADNIYRIIGITDGTDGTEKGQLKVIKATSTGESQRWSYKNDRVSKWNESLIYTYLNETFLNSLKYERIRKLIEIHNWNMELQHSENWPSTNPLSSSIAKDGTVEAYVGLMYATDHANAGANEYNTTKNWLDISYGWKTSTDEWEWTMTRRGLFSSQGWESAWRAQKGELNGGITLSSVAPVRPVFYLSKTIGLIGDGTENIPYTITTIK